MSAETITVVATFQAQPGKKKELRAALTGLVAPTRKETGCLNYDLHVSPEDPAKFLFHENWASRAHLDAHFHSPHIQALLPRVDKLCVGAPQITMWEKIG
jgi:quinol monooxygenase YgiN